MPRLVEIDAASDAPAARPLWHERTLILRQKSGRVHGIDGWKYGTLILHRTLRQSFGVPAFTVTHWPSKVAVARLSDWDEAVAQVEWLWDTCPAAWSGEDVDKARVPVEVMQWLRAHQ